MGAELLQASIFVQDRVNELDGFLSSLPEQDRPSWSIYGELLAPAASSRLSEAAISQPLCTAVQIVLVDLLKAAGIEFHAVVGHSSGEIGAAYSAGLMTAKDAIRGAMMAVGTSPEDATGFCELEGFQGRIQVAALNSSSSITLSGDEDAIEEAVEIFKDEQKFARRLKVDTAYHSSHMLRCSGPYLDSMRRCEVRPLGGNDTKWYSSVVDGAVMSQDALSEQYWVDNMTNAVLFSSAITNAAAKSGPFDLVIELGPHPALKGPALDNLSEAGINPPYTGVLARGQNDAEELSSTLGAIWTTLGSGSVNLDYFERLVSGSTEPRKLLTGLPGYAFDHQRTFWTESRVSGAYKQGRSPPHPILGSVSVEGTSSTETVWRNLSRVKEISWLQGQKLQGQVVFPATGYVAMAVEAPNIIAKEKGVNSIFRVRVTRLDKHHISAEFVCESCPAGENSMAVNARGRVELSLGDISSDTLPQPKPSGLFNLVDVEVDRFYHALNKVGYEYSHPFQGISNIKRKIDFAVGQIEDQSGTSWEDQLISLHVPVKVEAFVINPIFSAAGSRKYVVLPYEVSVKEEQGASGIVADIELRSDNSHHTFVRIEGVNLAPYQLAGPSGILAVLGERPSDYKIKMAKDLEKVSYFYLRRLSETIPIKDREHTLLHYQRLLNWADHIYRERINVRLIESVSENLPHMIRDGSNILEHITKDGILSRFYKDGLGLAASNRWISRIVKQICHRYPHMNILEIGAGTGGGSTRIILPAIGSAFSTYTYTDISSAFFEAAEERFKKYADRMVFKTFDMERDPLDQGFIEGSYDLIIASNVLHATDKLEMMTNVRNLLKPGGYLVNLEVVNNDPLRNGLPMGGLPGWWIGAESGRSWGPTLTLPQWDDLVTACGFAGIETATPDYDELHPFSVWAAMAADDRINILREPLALLPDAAVDERPQLTIIGGKSLRTFGLVEQLSTILSTKFLHVQRVPSVGTLVSNPIPSGSTVLGLTELDEPLLRTVTEDKLEGLKSMWGLGRNILWVTRGSRAEEPHSFMMVGIGRALRFEYPNINLQTLDFNKIDSTTREKPLTNLIWSSEPEIIIENSKTLIPRLYPNQEQNQRHNSRRLGTVGHLMLFISVEETTGSTYLALADSTESPVRVVTDCTIHLPSQSPKFTLIALQSTTVYLLTHQVLSLLPSSSKVLIHDADRALRETILSIAKKAGVKPLFTTSDLRHEIPGSNIVTAFFDFSHADGPSSKAARLIHDNLPAHCQYFPISIFFGNSTALRPSSIVSGAGEILRAVWNEANSANGIYVEPTTPIPLSSLRDASPFQQGLSVIDWKTSSVLVGVVTVDNDTVFHPDKTYLMVGLSGEVGQSLCEWMVKHGAKYVVLTSRKPKVNPEFVRHLESYGATIRTISLDITSRDSLQRCYDEINRTLPPVGGVANGAMVLQDILFQKMDLEALTKVLRPKVEGSKLLDEFFHDTPLDFFIIFSSITAVVGNSGQSNYIATNIFITALAFQRRKRRVPGSVMDISSLVGIGYMERSDNFDAEYFANIGYTNISEQDLHQMFAEAILIGRPDSTQSAEIVTGFAPAYADKEIKAQYRNAMLIIHRVYLASFDTRLRKILQIPEEEPVNDKVALVEQGVDSLVAVEVRSWFLKELDIEMPVLKVLGGNSIIDLLNDAMERIPASILQLDPTSVTEPVPRPKLPVSKPSALSLLTVSSSEGIIYGC
ncbi:KR domain-containing protein [Triangularia verruculosa]|uniref:KR domain-containing protein n=1 Tax=Triangularia verruculosa TaxID=2587418 RepID=A0AAN6X6E8_9PEZI|nr:KR domain-containing protein [Triangularia verruculosa]